MHSSTILECSLRHLPIACYHAISFTLHISVHFRCQQLYTANQRGAQVSRYRYNMNIYMHVTYMYIKYGCIYNTDIASEV